MMSNTPSMNRLGSSAIVEVSTIACPECGGITEERMPETSCQIGYQCKHCGATLQPEEGDCCVYCTYGSVPCPPVQREGGAASDQEKPSTLLNAPARRSIAQPFGIDAVDH